MSPRDFFFLSRDIVEKDFYPKACSTFKSNHVINTLPANFNFAVRKTRLLASAPDPPRSKSETSIRRGFSTYYYCDLSDEFLIFYETSIRRGFSTYYYCDL